MHLVELYDYMNGSKTLDCGKMSKKELLEEYERRIYRKAWWSALYYYIDIYVSRITSKTCIPIASYHIINIVIKRVRERIEKDVEEEVIPVSTGIYS